MCRLCVLVYRLCSVPYHEVLSIVQPGFQPQSATTPFLDSGCPRAFFKLDDQVCMPITIYNIIHRLIYDIYEYNIQKVKYIQLGHQFISLWGFYLTFL